jgi:hypothetical protein
VQLDKFIFSVVGDLKLELPVSIKLCTREKKIAAVYEPKFKGENLKSHKIVVYMGGEHDRDLFTLVAHELIHAYQCENNLVDVHGKSFRLMARYLDLIYNLPDIYKPCQDI